MRLDKQRDLLVILSNYDVDTVSGVVYDKRGREIKFSKLPNGYYQRVLYNGKRNRGGIDVSVQGKYYLHQVVYFAKYGFYDSDCVIDHIDRDKGNNRIDNLRCVSHRDNVLNSLDRVRVDGCKLVRRFEIAEIRRLMGQGLSQSAIARNLGLNRLTVRLTMKKIESGATLRYEGYDTMVERVGRMRTHKTSTKRHIQEMQPFCEIRQKSIT